MRCDACVAHHERLTALRPKYPDVWYNHGILLAETGKPAEALLSVNRALEIHSHYIDAEISRAFLLAETGRAADGFRDFKRFHVRSPDDFSTLFALGIFCMRNGWKAQS